MENFSPGEIVRLKSAAKGGGSICLLVSVSQKYWDYGEGECGFTDIAEVLLEGRPVQVPLGWLETIWKDETWNPESLV